MAASCPYGTNLQDTTNCALINEKERDPLEPFERPTDTPILIPRNLFSTNLQSNLEQCDGTTSCQYVGFDFETDTGTRINTMKYDIDISQVGGSKGVFTKEGHTVPTMMVAPPGYTYDFMSIRGTVIGATCPGGGELYEDYCRIYANENYAGLPCACYHSCPSGWTEIGFSNDAWHACSGCPGFTPKYCRKEPIIVGENAYYDGILGCKRTCDANQTCKGFNFTPIFKTCLLYSSIIDYSYDSSKVSFTRHDFPTSEGKLFPEIRDSVTYLGNTGSDCGKMNECNSNIAQVFDTPGVQSFSTTDIDTCGFCPVKTVNKVSSDYYVRDEVGKTTKYTQKDAALAALQYSKVPNPITTSESSLLALYKITPYTGTQTRYIFITRSKNIIYVHTEHHDPNTIDPNTGESPSPGSLAFPFPINAVQFSFILDDGTVMATPPTLTQFGQENKMTSIVGNGTTTTVTTAMAHNLTSTSTIFLYGDDLPSSFLNPTVITGNITIIDNPDPTSTSNPKYLLPSVSFTFPSDYSGSSSAVKMFFSKSEGRGIPTWNMIPVDYVTNGFQFRTTGFKYLKKNTSTKYTQYTMPLFFGTRVGKPEKYSKDFADTVFIVEKVQIGSQYSVYECPAFNQRNSDCYDYGEKHRGHTWFLEPEKCESAPTLNRWTGTPTCAGMCNTGCPDGFRKLIDDDIGCLNYLTNGFNMSRGCRYEPGPTIRTVDTIYDMIFEMFTGSGIYDYPENMIFQSLTGTKYLLENKKLRKIKNDIMYYYVIKNSGTDNWNTLTVPSIEMLDDMPKGPDVTVPQDTGPDTDNNFYNVNVNALNVSPVSSTNYENLTQKAWVTQILTCPTGSYSTEGIKPCTVCPPNSTSRADHKACVCSDTMYFWNDATNTCDLKGCTGNKYNLINGKEPCTECVSGSTVSSDHTRCVCPSVVNGTNTWQAGTNTCTLVCNQGYTAYGNRCIDNLPNSIAQAALDLERQRIQFAFTPTGGAPPPVAPNSDIQNALNRERDRITYSLIIVNNITSITQAQLDIQMTGALKYSVPCKPDGGFYSSTGFEPCLPCKTCTTPTNGTLTELACSVTTDTICTYQCNPGFVLSVSDVLPSSPTCQCLSGSYIKPDGTCEVCSSCPADTEYSNYTASGCTTIDTTSDRTCRLSCKYASGYYNLNGVCTSCPTTRCPIVQYATLVDCPSTGSCTYTCNEGFTKSSIKFYPPSCTCSVGRYINSVGKCLACTACPANTISTIYVKSGCNKLNSSVDDVTCTRTCAAGYYDNNGVCAQCPSGYYTVNGVCTPCNTSTCPANTTSTMYTFSGCSGSTGPGTCIPSCRNGYTMVNGVCTCQAGYYIRSSDNTCQPCSTSCGTGNYISASCSATSDIKCTTCSTSCPYLAGGVNSSSCVGTEIANPVCTCPVNSQPFIYPITITTTGNYCSCVAGFYSSTGIAPCTPCGPCGPNEMRVNCGSANPGTCYCVSGYNRDPALFGNSTCYKLATRISTYPYYGCPSGYTLTLVSNSAYYCLLSGTGITLPGLTLTTF